MKPFTYERAASAQAAVKAVQPTASAARRGRVHKVMADPSKGCRPKQADSPLCADGGTRRIGPPPDGLSAFAYADRVADLIVRAGKPNRP